MSVLEIQQALLAAGFDPGGLDGKSGPKTKAAIRAYQQANGLAVDGIAGTNTQAKLRGASGAPAASTAGNGQSTYQAKYPQFAWAFNAPEVANLLNTAMANKWGPDELQGAIQQTTWWRSKTNAERDWLQTAALNPADANRQMNNYDSISKYIALAADYGIPATFESARDQVSRVVAGTSTPDALGQELRNQAKAMYPQLAQQIDAGSTVADVYAPYKQMAAQLLGVHADTIMLSDPKWQAPLQVTDGKGGRRVATTDEWQRMLRTDARFGYDRTSGGRQEAATFATQLGKEFGVLG